MTDRKPRLVETMVSWIHPQVMVFLGKIMNPMTQKTERDLVAARALIDLLSELEEKTEGKLDDGERRLLRTALTELRLNYLDEMNKPATEAGEDRKTGDLPAEAEAPDTGSSGTPDETAGEPSRGDQ